MKKLVFLCALCALCALCGGLAFAADCPANQWCQVLNNSMPPNSGWNQLVFVHDTGKFYNYMNNANVLPNPFESTFWTYTAQTATHSAYTACDNGQPCWAKASDCGDTAGTSSITASVCLVTAMDATTTPGSLQIVTNNGNPIGSMWTLNPANSPNSTYYLAIDDEVISFTGCTDANSATCNVGAVSPFTLTGITRGLRGTTKTIHNGGGTTNCNSRVLSSGEAARVRNACVAPAYNGGAADVTKDHPPTRHPGAQVFYQSSTGKLWDSWGWIDNYAPLRDMWFMCVAQTATCTTSEIAKGWQRVPTSLRNAPNNTEFEAAGWTAQNAVVYDPDHDVAFSYGGANADPSKNWDIWVLCLTANASVYIDSTHTCASANYVNYWHKITPASGSAQTVASQSPRGNYDPVNHFVVYFGGEHAAGLLYVAQIWLPEYGEWCFSDLAQGGANGNNCPNQFKTPPADRYPGSAPAPAKFPAWTYNNNSSIQKFMYLTPENPSKLYLYDAGTNKFTLTSVTGGPNFSAMPYMAGQSMAHDDVNSVTVWENQHQSGNPPQSTWQLPDAALGGETPVTYSVGAAIGGSGTGTVVSGETPAFINCPGVCSHIYDAGSNVTLTATATGGSSFLGWSGPSADACSGATCTFSNLSAVKNVTASFGAPLGGSSMTFSGVTISGVKVAQ